MKTGKNVDGSIDRSVDGSIVNTFIAFVILECLFASDSMGFMFIRPT